MGGVTDHWKRRSLSRLKAFLPRTVPLSPMELDVKLDDDDVVVFMKERGSSFSRWVRSISELPTEMATCGVVEDSPREEIL